MDFKHKKILVAGLGRSGFAAARLLKKQGARVWASDRQDSVHIQNLALALRKAGVFVETGAHTPEFTDGKDIIVISPGVPSDLPFLKKAKRNRIPVISEIELGFLLCPSPIIAVTGTNGKTTVTTLIGRVLEEAGRRSVVCGNIGNPFTGELDKLDRDSLVVLETSSFQLENISQFRPYIALVLNISPDHLDRYSTFEEYVRAKERIFMNQTSSDFAVLNYRDSIVRGFRDKTKAKTLFFNKNEDARGLNDNQRAVLAVGALMAVAEETVFSVFRNFKGLEHRYEYVAEIEGIKFINDSKATNIHSTLYALNSSAQRLILIAGGRDKGQDFQPVRQWLGKKVKYLILIGEGADKIEAVARDCAPVKRAGSLEEAVGFAYSIAERGDLVLLSPMCASFDMFENYEHRGRVFKEAVLSLKGAYKKEVGVDNA